MPSASAVDKMAHSFSQQIHNKNANRNNKTATQWNGKTSYTPVIPAIIHERDKNCKQTLNKGNCPLFIIQSFILHLLRHPPENK